MIIKRQEYKTVKPGWYEAVVSDVEEVEGQYGPQIRLRFDIGGGVSVLGWANASLGPRSKLTKWVKGILGEVPDILDTADLVGRRCRILLDNVEGKNGTYNTIVSIKTAAQVEPERPPRPILDDESESIPF